MTYAATESQFESLIARVEFLLRDINRRQDQIDHRANPARFLSEGIERNEAEIEGIRIVLKAFKVPFEAHFDYAQHKYTRFSFGDKIVNICEEAALATCTI